MPSLILKTLIAAPVAKVWLFHMDPERNLPRVWEGAPRVEVESADRPLAAGALIRLRVHWHGRTIGIRHCITDFHAPHTVLFGQEARFTEVQEEGPFAQWTHCHEMEATEDGRTLLRDVVSYRLRGGAWGKLQDLLLVRWRIAIAFRRRNRRIRDLLEDAGGTRGLGAAPLKP